MSVNGFNWIENLSEFHKGFIKRYYEKSKEGYFLKADIQYPEYLNNTKIVKVKKLVANLHVKNECIIHIRNLKQALTYGLVLKKIHRFIKLHQKVWLKSDIEMKKTLKDFEKDFFKLINNSAFGKILHNIWKYRDIKRIITIKEETIWYQNQVIIARSFLQKIWKFVSNRNEENSTAYEQTCLFRSINIRIK